jgi:hypothetical protein
MTKNTQDHTGELFPLVGGTITGTIWFQRSEGDDTDQFFGIEVTRNGYKIDVYFLMDEEGNGPGSFWIWGTED